MVLGSNSLRGNHPNQGPQNQPIQPIQLAQHVMVDNSVYPDDYVQHIDFDNFAQLEDVLPPVNQLKLTRENGYYLDRTDNQDQN